MKIYDVTYLDSNNNLLVKNKCFAERKTEDVEKWYKKHMGATIVSVKEITNPGYDGNLIVRLD